MMSKMFPDAEGNVSMSNFVTYFTERLPDDRVEFDNTIAQFMDCAEHRLKDPGTKKKKKKKKNKAGSNPPEAPVPPAPSTRATPPGKKTVQAAPGSATKLTQVAQDHFSEGAR